MLVKWYMRITKIYIIKENKVLNKDEKFKIEENKVGKYLKLWMKLV